MANYWKFKSTIVLKESPLVKGNQNSKILCHAIRQRHRCKKTGWLWSLHGQWKTRNWILGANIPGGIFLNDMCLDAEMVHLYEHFVLCKSILLSMYWREACAFHYDENDLEGTWNARAFVFIMKEYKNQVHSSENSVATRDFLQTYFQRGLKKQHDMTALAFKAHFKVLFKFYDKLKADYKLAVGEKEKTLLLCHDFSGQHCHMIVQQQDDNVLFCRLLSDLSFNRPSHLSTT